METYDLLQVAGREWRTLCHSADFAAKEKSLLGGTGSCGGIITAPYGGSQRSRKHSNCAVRGQQESTGKSQTQQGGCASQRPVGLSLKIGFGWGARPSLTWVRGQATLFVNTHGPTPGNMPRTSTSTGSEDPPVLDSDPEGGRKKGVLCHIFTLSPRKIPATTLMGVLRTRG